jgi:hypothetical protein
MHTWQSVALGPAPPQKMSGTLATVFVDSKRTVARFYAACQGIVTIQG